MTMRHERSAFPKRGKGKRGVGRIASSATLVFIATALLAGMAEAQIVTVPNHYPSIQSAINAVASGARPNGTAIQVAAGTYNETLLIADTTRSMSIVGLSGPAVTIVDAVGKRPVGAAHHSRERQPQHPGAGVPERHRRASPPAAGSRSKTRRRRC